MKRLPTLNEFMLTSTGVGKPMLKLRSVQLIVVLDEYHVQDDKICYVITKEDEDKKIASSIIFYYCSY